MPSQARSNRRGLTRAMIVAHAIARADAAGGIDSIAMRPLAAELGVEAMSLYNHVRNKDDLLDAMVEAVLLEIALPQPGADWREAMRERARSMRAMFLAHPWAPELIMARRNVGPNMIALIDATLGCLRQAGYAPDEADRIINAIDSQIYGFHLIERSFPVRREDYAETARAHLHLIDPERFPHMRALSQAVAEHRYNAVHHMEFGLDLLLAALARKAPSGPAMPSPGG